MNFRRVVIGFALSAVALAVGDQLVLHTAVDDGALLGHELAPFAPPLYSPYQRQLLEDYEVRLRDDRPAFDRVTQFDAELGWCPRPGMKTQLSNFDWAGSRVAREPLPRVRAADQRLVGLIGGSFTHGSEVRSDESWAAALELHDKGTLFGNFGVAGYGLGQTLLRYRRDVTPLEPDEVWLGYLPHAALRSTSSFPTLYLRWRARTINFKPSFSLDENDALVLHPSPAETPEDILRLLRDPSAFLDAIEDGDRWIRRVPAAYQPLGEHWLHHTALGRVALTMQERGGRDHRALMADTGSDIFSLNRELVLTLAREVAANGARFRLVVLPSGSDLRGLRPGDRPYWQALVEQLSKSGVEVLDLTPTLLGAGIRDGQSDEYWRPQGHYSPRTNQIVADEIARNWLAD